MGALESDFCSRIFGAEVALLADVTQSFRRV